MDSNIRKINAKIIRSHYFDFDSLMQPKQTQTAASLERKTWPHIIILPALIVFLVWMLHSLMLWLITHIGGVWAWLIMQLLWVNKYRHVLRKRLISVTIRVASYLWSPLSGWNPIKHCNGIFIQFQNGVAFSYLVLHLNFWWQTLKDNI